MMKETTRSALKDAPYTLWVKDIEWKGEQRVLLRPYRQYWLAEEMVLRIPETEQ